MAINWKQTIVTVVIVMLGIYAFKWVNSQYRIPIVGEIIETV